MWSIGNEVNEQTDPANGVRIGKRRRRSRTREGSDRGPRSSATARRDDDERPAGGDGHLRRELTCRTVRRVHLRTTRAGHPRQRDGFDGQPRAANSSTSRFPRGLPSREAFPEGYYNFQVSGYDVFSQRPNNCAPDYEFPLAGAQPAGLRRVRLDRLRLPRGPSPTRRCPRR
jgi:hypothetical protein